MSYQSELPLDWSKEAWNRISDKVARTSQRIRDRFPHASVNGQYQLEPASWWTAGFWPGLLWLVYRDTNNQQLGSLAASCEEQLDQVILDYDRLDHDIGFMWTLTSVARYKILGEPSAKRRGLLAANLLAGRYNSRGRFIRAWNPWKPGDDNAGWAIIDCMMNLPLLHWASEVTGDPRYKQIAIQHSDTVLAHFIRPDGSVNHIVVFDPETGEKVDTLGGQGFAPASGWSRGTAWALYGMSLAYQYTGEERYLQAAKRVAHYFIANLPEDHVPHWDFRLPPDIVKHRDSSAGACGASALLLLSRLVADEERSLYAQAGERILRSLYENYGAWDREDEEGLITHGTSHYPEGRNIDVPLIYGDYYFAEGIAQLVGYEDLFW
ncbi:unsaturated chondroitin disaccharide hydrolase [Paenibacillus cellulosilyticus]|uniref:Unsaturated chondroitin disaccharide hydrolase n=1 Tax=Paenibacillus cellulosilyticus TaxID=375489 RepID=A0A2V2YSS6_9BACL|nr:glycoside hydrolase family 88 protein [Paenibacillus cellulosilyticus]PWW00972.1 unsaturated chondroitin disaccharide hydrolase [Paenibacillus cellulosilyticus]QKS47616.1 glycoside hydrolase family 88 protein [Paenibacillus cellulosilyticus]